ncbi:unnamed protein product [Lymnaea stagnalis]|uniref:Uncharacterized protein n=1 Tax=Lymnaea stagnalis TaxID=6523 RepID=A0AAV2HCU9_LYMST
MKFVMCAISCFLQVGLLMSIPFGDPCSTSAISRLSGPEEVYEVNIPKNCTSGEIDWNYPRGYLHVKLSKLRVTYSLCVVEGWATWIKGVRELTGGVNNTLNMPTAGHPACTKAVDGSTELLVLAEDTLFYMISFNYTVVGK